jgi:hypothetical protein
MRGIEVVCSKWRVAIHEEHKQDGARRRSYNSEVLLSRAGAFDKLGKILPECFVVHITNIYDEGLSSIRRAILGR